MILVIGGTGTTGRPLLARLAELDVPARALVRSRSRAGGAVPVGVPVVEGDVGDPAALSAALIGARQVFLALGNGPQQEQLELAVVAAAAAAGVEHLVKVSAPVIEPDVPVAIARMHGRVERAVAAAGLVGTALRPYAFQQNLLNSAPVIAGTGEFVGTTGDAPVNLVDARDVAEVALHVLTRRELRGRAHVLTGPEAVSYPEVARRLTVLGRPTRYVDLPPTDFRVGLQRAGLPPWLVDHLVEIQRLAVDRPERPTDTVARITGRAPRSVSAFLHEHLHRFRPADAPLPPRPVPVG